MNKIVFDIETKNTFFDTGSKDPASLDISVVGIYDYTEDSYTCYEESELPKLWPIVERADMIIGFNSDHFDIPLLNKYYPGDLSHIKSLDLMKEIKDSLGRRIGLGAIAQATLGKGKIGNGLDAIAWWKAGQIDKIKKYCLEDVKITKELYEFAKLNKKLQYKDGLTVMDIKLDPTEWEVKKEAALTFTLPF